MIIPTIDQCLNSSVLLGAGLGAPPSSFARWIAILKAIFGVPLTEDEHQFFLTVSGGRAPPERRCEEVHVIVGRRGGKTKTAVAIACYLAIEEHLLSPGEVGHVILLARDSAQAQQAFSYAVAFFEASPILKQWVESKTRDEIRLANGVCIGVHTNSFKSIRGRTMLAVVADELAFWDSDASANPDTEVFSSCTSALAASKGMWISISTGHMQTGLLYTKYKEHFGKAEPDNILVIQGASDLFNPQLDEAARLRIFNADPAKYAAEWEGGWRRDLASYLDAATIDRAIDRDRPIMLPPDPAKAGCYAAFTDTSGGAPGGDAFTLCIAHKEGEQLIVDAIAGVPPGFDPEEATKQLAEICRRYYCRSVTGDRYSGAWCASMFKKYKVDYKPVELRKSDIYLESIPLFMTGRVSMPDDPRAITELRQLERRTYPGGKDIIDHPDRGHDDFINSVCGAITLLTVSSPREIYLRCIGPAYRPEAEKKEEPVSPLMMMEDVRQHPERYRVIGPCIERIDEPVKDERPQANQVLNNIYSGFDARGRYFGR